MGAPAEVLEEIFTVIEGGRTIGEAAEIIQFPSDSGTRTFTAVNQTFKGTNGTGLNYWVAAIAQGASAISAGALMVTVALPEFMAMAVPCLGITVGTAWYNIDPEGWTNLALLLSNAGWTIHDKVVGFMIEKGIISFPPETIEMLKEELCRLGAFDIGDPWDGEKPEQFAVVEPLISSDKQIAIVVNSTVHVGCYYAGVVHDERYQPYVYRGVAVEPNTTAKDFKITSAIVNNILWWVISSKESFRLATWSYDLSTLNFTGSGVTGNPSHYTYDGKTVYYIDGHSFSDERQPGTISLGTNAINLASDVTIAQVAWLLQYGQFEKSSRDKTQQKGAQFPQQGVPFRTTYPNWLPWEFPDLPGWQIPEVMPIQYPQLLPVPEPYQDPAQNPEGDDETADEGVKKLEDPESDPEEEEDDDKEDEEDPEEGEEGEDIEDPTDGEDTPEPIEPDPPTPITPVIPITPLPDSVHSNKLFTVYNPTSSQLGDLGGYLWDNDLIDILRKIWQNPLDGIISLIQVYATPVTGGNSNIILGYLDSGVSAKIVSNQFVTIDCGSITINEQSENCLDYIPYTKMELYLPFIGVTEIDTNEFMAGTINIKYKVDVYTGTCLAEVKCTRNRDLANGTILYTFSGNCSQQIPLTSGDARGVLGALISAAGLGLSIASGGATAVTGAGLLRSGARVAGSLASMTSQEMLHVGHSGNLSANAGIMGQKKPYLIINRKRAYSANAYNRYYGFPANKTVSPGNHTGFLRLKAGRLQSAATEQEKEEIYKLITSGVIM